jgi:uncharacterized membrane protein YhaH (DUF805 family)
VDSGREYWTVCAFWVVAYIVVASLSLIESIVFTSLQAASGPTRKSWTSFIRLFPVLIHR